MIVSWPRAVYGLIQDGLFGQPFYGRPRKVSATSHISPPCG